MTNVFRTLLVPESKAASFESLCVQLGQPGMFVRKLSIGSTALPSSYRISSGIIDSTVDTVFSGGIACQEYLQSKGITLTLAEISNILSGSVVSDKKPLDLMADMNLVFTAEPGL